VVRDGIRPDHFHLVQTPEPNLSRGMQWLNGTYAAWFNHRHQRAGHLFQGRFHAFLVEKESYFAELLRYVVLNPVRANMVERPEDYRWSSYRATAGLELAPAWLDVASALAWLNVDAAAAKTAYRELVFEKAGCEDQLRDKVTHAMYLGSEPWKEWSGAAMQYTRPRTGSLRLDGDAGHARLHART
jgi:putative transposase